MQTVAAWLLMVASSSLPSPTLSIYLVDRGWLPLPGMEITVQQVGKCGEKTLKSIGDPKRVNTNSSGVAKLEIVGPANYQVEVPAQRGFKTTSKCIHLYEMLPGQDNPAVQLQVVLR